MIEETLNNLKLINQLEILIPIAILSVILVAISKSGFGGALGSLGLPVMVLAFPAKTCDRNFVTIIFNHRYFCSIHMEKISCIKDLKIDGTWRASRSSTRLDMF